MRLDLGQPAALISGPCCDAILGAGADLQVRTRAANAFGKGVVDAGLHQEAVGADAGLAGVAVFGDQSAVDRGIEIGIVENDEGRVAAQFQRQLLDGRRALRHQQAADFGRTGERQLAHDGAGAQLAANGRRVAGDDIENAWPANRRARPARPAPAPSAASLGRLDDHRAAGGQRRGDLAGDHGEREIPRRDRRADADRLLDDSRRVLAAVLGMLSP
jgi:hypothetical protein